MVRLDAYTEIQPMPSSSLLNIMLYQRYVFNIHISKIGKMDYDN